MATFAWKADAHESEGGAACIVSRRWWFQRWGDESCNNAHYLCCEQPLRSSYNASRLRQLARAGVPLLWFAGTESDGEATVDRMRDGSGGQALHAALALCDRVDVYGMGLLGLGGLGGVRGLVSIPYSMYPLQHCASSLFSHSSGTRGSCAGRRVYSFLRRAPRKMRTPAGA